jgi:NAD(P)H-dependent FMN reductase
MTKPNLLIISASVRDGRASHRVALYLQHFINQGQEAQASILDLKDKQFPLFEERFHLIKNPSSAMVDLSESIKKADGVIIVSPEYNGGYPASLKNIIDFLYQEWRRKPIAFASVSAGAFGASQVLTSLPFSLWKIGALLVPGFFQAASVEQNYTEDGKAVNESETNRRAERFVNELLYWVKAIEGSREE